MHQEFIYGVAACVFLMLAGLGICWLSKESRFGLATTLFWWVGFIIALIGLLIVLANIILFVAGMLKGATGV